MPSHIPWWQQMIHLCIKTHHNQHRWQRGQENLEWEEVFGSLTVAVIIGRSCHKYNFCCNKSFCCDKHVCHDKHMFVMTKKIFCHNTYACHDKYLLWRKFCCDMLTFVVTSVFVTTKHLFCHDKSLLSWQSMLVTTKIVCCDKYNFVTTIFFFLGKHTFVTTKEVTKLLLQQKLYLWQLPPVILSRWTLKLTILLLCSVWVALSFRCYMHSHLL